MPRRAFCSAAEGCASRRSTRVGPSSSGSFAATACPSGSAPITARRLRLLPWAGSRRSRCGGSAWGFGPSSSSPRTPEQNGRHERMHKTLKAETARPPRRTLAAQQRRFDWFRQRYNTERPHEALGQRLPASLYHASPRPYSTRLLPITYPGHYEVRRVSRNGGIRWGSRWVNVSHVLAELDVGFEEIDDGLWEVHFGPVWLGRLHETTCRIVDHLGRAARREGGNHKGKVLPIS